MFEVIKKVISLKKQNHYFATHALSLVFFICTHIMFVLLAFCSCFQFVSEFRSVGFLFVHVFNLFSLSVCLCFMFVLLVLCSRFQSVSEFRSFVFVLVCSCFQSVSEFRSFGVSVFYVRFVSFLFMFSIFAIVRPFGVSVLFFSCC